MVDVKMPHPGHDKHLCFLDNIGYVKSSLEQYKELVKNPKYVCKNCGRVAANDQNLCKPDSL